MNSNCSFEHLKDQYGTPLYIYDLEKVEQNYLSLKNYIKWPKLRIFYAMKANYNLGILKSLQQIGACMETVSPAEVFLALKLGFSGENILFTANNLTEEEMKEVYEKNQKICFNLGSLSELKKFGNLFPGSSICLRFNPDVVAGEFPSIQTAGHLTKFGILLQDIDKVLEIVNEYKLNVIGVHEHTGSGIQETGQVFESMKNLLDIVDKDRFPNLKFIDFGGGFKVAYKPKETTYDYEKFGKQMVEIFKDFCENKYGKDLEMFFEPGKYIVANSGSFLVSVNTIKDNRGRLIAGTNSGFPQLIRPMFYGAYHEIENVSNPKGEKKLYDIVGNICETGDNFASDRELNEIREGDLLLIKNAGKHLDDIFFLQKGAYCYSMGGIYNMRSMPTEIVIEKNGIPKLTRKRETNQELTDNLFSMYQNI